MINFFCSVEQLDVWRQGHPGASGRALTLAQAAAFGRFWRAAVGRDE